MPPPDPLAVFTRICSDATLAAGWRRVRRNGGGAGGDGETPQAFARDLTGSIRRLSRELREGCYRPGPLRSWVIAKPGGGVRRLAVPPVRDRVAQSAAVIILAPLVESRMSRASFAYRAGLSVEQAAALVTFYRLRGFTWVVDGDIADFFPSILHAPLRARFVEAVDCQRTRDLIALWLAAFSPAGRGLAQGAPLSPLLSNLALADVDRAVDSRKVRLVRYADDFLLMTRTRPEAEAAAARLAELLRPLGLTLNAAKTRIAHLDEGIRFLGYRFERDRILRSEWARSSTRAGPRAASSPCSSGQTLRLTARVTVYRAVSFPSSSGQPRRRIEL
ncbi:MAG: reverse transcriptase domain-containing protein [Xanthobacteraceae bacterium]|nr:reverse transcriptase domain-containing protein [Xanthobacteraceae bacterium]